VLLEACEDWGGCDWEWQAADGAMGKARMGGDLIGPNPTDRGKNGVKRSLLVEKDGGPLAVVIAGANVPDHKLLAATLEAVVVERPDPEPDRPQHLCVDYEYTPHIQLISRPAPAREEAIQAQAMGCGADAGVVIQVPSNPGPLGQKGVQLPGPPEARLRAAVVPTVSSLHHMVLTAEAGMRRAR